MKNSYFDCKTICIYIAILVSFLAISLMGSRAVTVFSEIKQPKMQVIIDAGHGGVDGGAVSCTGVAESQINLQIAKKLEDLFHLIGVHTVMIRDTDRSVYTEGTTIAAKKVSDIRERVRIVNETPNAILVSIHQNNFPDPKYFGPQVFYNSQPGSKELAEKLQFALREYLPAGGKRSIKKSSGVYLMEHTNCTGVLVECGFLSNIREEAMLRDEAYQQQLSIVISTTISQYLNT